MGKRWEKLYQLLGGGETSFSKNFVLLVLYYAKALSLSQYDFTEFICNRQRVNKILSELQAEGYIESDSCEYLRVYIGHNSPKIYSITQKGERKIKKSIQDSMVHINITNNYFSVRNDDGHLIHTYGITSAFYDILPYLSEGDCFQSEKQIANAEFRPDFYFCIEKLMRGECFGEEDTGSQRINTIRKKAQNYARYLKFRKQYQTDLSNFSLLFHLNDLKLLPKYRFTSAISEDYIRRITMGYLVKRAELIEEAVIEELAPYWEQGFQTLIFPTRYMDLSLVEPFRLKSFHMILKNKGICLAREVVADNIILKNNATIRLRYTSYAAGHMITFLNLEHDISARYLFRLIMQHGVKEQLTVVASGTSEDVRYLESLMPEREITLIPILNKAVVSC